MYYKSKLTDNIYNENYDLIVMNERLQPYQDWLTWRLNGGVEQSFIGTEEEIVEKLNNEETERYIQRINDGIKLVSKFSAKLRVAKIKGVIDEESHKAIDDALIPVRTEVLAGQFISAKDKLIVLGATLIGQELYNEVLTELNNYISLNYVG